MGVTVILWYCGCAFSFLQKIKPKITFNLKYFFIKSLIFNYSFVFPYFWYPNAYYGQNFLILFRDKAALTNFQMYRILDKLDWNSNFCVFIFKTLWPRSIFKVKYGAFFQPRLHYFEKITHHDFAFFTVSKVFLESLGNFSRARKIVKILQDSIWKYWLR